MFVRVQSKIQDLHLWGSGWGSDLVVRETREVSSVLGLSRKSSVILSASERFHTSR